MEEKNPVSELLETTLKNLKNLVNTDVVIGKEIVTDENMTIIPVSKVSLGYGTGGGTPSEKFKFGGGSGGGVTVNPMGFLVIKEGDVRLMQFSSADNTADRVVNMMPDVIDKISSLFQKEKEKKYKVVVEDEKN